MRSIAKGIAIAAILFGWSCLIVGCGKTEVLETKPAAAVNSDAPTGPDASKIGMPSKKEFNDGKN